MMIGKGNGEGSKRTRFVARTTCSRCEVTLTPENKNFGKCKPCAKAAQAENVSRYEDRDPERARRLARARDKKREQKPARKMALRAASKAWAKSNIARVNAAHAIRESRRRSRKAGNGGDVTASDWNEQLEVFGHCCAYCLRSGMKLQMEHIIPIARGGPHTIDNVVPSCGPCNFRKHARGPLVLINRAFEKAA